MKREKLIQEVAKHNWMHTINLGQGVVTPGRWPTNQYVMRAYGCVHTTASISKARRC